MTRPYRRILACIFLMSFLTFWIWGAATVGTALSTAPAWITLPFFIIAGLGWVFAIRPVFRWMNTGPES